MNHSRIIVAAITMTVITMTVIIPANLMADENSTSRTRTEGAVALYGDGRATAALETLSLQRENGNLRLGISRRQALDTPPGDGTSPLTGTETGFTISGELPAIANLDQLTEFTITPRTGYLMTGSGDDKSRTAWAGAAASFWTGEQTTRWTLDVQRNFTTAPRLDVTDVDGKRILTPERIGGTSAGVNWMHLATPEFLWRGGVSVILRDDRPEARAASLEGRYFIVPVNAAVHASATRFENRGPLEPVTLTGSIEATSASAEWHQKIGERIILAPGYRWYRETETPRAINGARKILGTDHIHATIRYRFWRDYWLEDAPEAFVTAGSIQSSSGLRIWQFAAGGSLLVVGRR